MIKFVLLLGALLGPNASAALLSVEDFLQQVAEHNEGVKAKQLRSSGQELRSSEGAFLYSPLLSAEFSHLLDKRETVQAAFSGTQTESNTYSVAISQLTPWGLQGRVGYSVFHTDVANASLLNPSHYYMMSPFGEATLSLLRNLGGSETRAIEASKRAGNRANSLASAYQYKAELFAAELSYWRLAAAREMLKVQKLVLQRADFILAWADRRSRLQLGDRSDLLQAKAAHDLRKLELATAEEELNAASLGFNQSLQREGKEVRDEIVFPSIESLLSLQSPARSEQRLDVRAAQEQAQALAAASQLAKEQVKPKLEAFGSYARNGKDMDYATGYKESWTGLHPVTTVGLRLAIPLEFGAVSRIYRGTNLEQEAASFEASRKAIDVESEWQDLSRRFVDLLERLKLLNNLEKTQKEKVDYERERLVKGRSTAYQVVSFESDYTQAVTLKVRTVTELLRTYAQMRLFGDKQW